MIRELKITNLALIESLQLTFTNGLTVLTGETGAGKSIILQAINLLAGAKASASLVRTGAEHATVEALFEIAGHKTEVRDYIENKGFETDEFLVLKRILSSQGRSRYYINGSLATARLVGDIAGNLISVASQHDHQQLLNPQRYLDLIDSIGDLWPERQKFKKLFAQWADLDIQLKQMQIQEVEKERRRDFLIFQCTEITEAQIKPDEDAILAREKNKLKAADTLTQIGLRSYQLLTENVNASLGQVRKDLEQMAELDQDIATTADKITDIFFQLEDNTDRIREYCDSIPNDPARLEIIDDRLDLLQSLKRKYGSVDGTLGEVLAHAEKVEQELNDISDIENRLALLGKERDLVQQQLLDKAVDLSNLRKKTASLLTKAVEKELSWLNFEQAKFEVQFEPIGQDLKNLDDTGWDRPRFMFSANPGEPTKPFAEIASGGELSRVMLGFKCILAQKDKVETVIFDEVDAGLSGKAASSVARKIKELAGHHQVLCISHLPQIASCADEHFIVSKNISNQRTQTVISRLTQDLRTKELARMMAGDSVTEQTLAYAQELMNGEHFNNNKSD